MPGDTPVVTISMDPLIVAYKGTTDFFFFLNDASKYAMYDDICLLMVEKS